MRCGLPDFLLTSEQDWHRFLGEAYDHATGWNPSMLTKNQQKALHDLGSKNTATLMLAVWSAIWNGCLESPALH